MSGRQPQDNNQHKSYNMIHPTPLETTMPRGRANDLRRGECGASTAIQLTNWLRARRDI
jgi:hypothetical protein